MCPVVHDTLIINGGFIIRVHKIMFSRQPRHIKILLEGTEQKLKKKLKLGLLYKTLFVRGPLQTWQAMYV